MSDKITGALESYLEHIAELQDEFGAVRTSDLAKRMGCKLPSVTSALQRLAEKGLINYKSYRPVTLTEAGKQTILRLNRYHGILADFLQNMLAFPEKFSQEEACRLEHRVSFKTLERMELLLKFFRDGNNKNLKLHKKEFKEFLKDLNS